MLAPESLNLDLVFTNNTRWGNLLSGIFLKKHTQMKCIFIFVQWCNQSYDLLPATQMIKAETGLPSHLLLVRTNPYPCSFGDLTTRVALSQFEKADRVNLFIRSQYITDSQMIQL